MQQAVEAVRPRHPVVAAAAQAKLQGRADTTRSLMNYGTAPAGAKKFMASSLTGGYADADAKFP